MFGTLFAEAVHVQAAQVETSSKSFVKPTANANVLEIDPSFMNKFNAAGIDFQGFADFHDVLASKKKSGNQASEGMDFAEAAKKAMADMDAEMTALRRSIQDNVPSEGTGAFSKSSEYCFIFNSSVN